MERIDITGDTVTVQLSSIEKVGAVHGDVVFPRSAVRSATVVPDAWTEVHGIRMPGYGMPGHAMLGTWRSGGNKDFVDVRHGHPGVVIELADAAFERVIISFESEAEAWAVARKLSAAP